MKIAVGCDPNAEEFKQQLIPFIEKQTLEAMIQFMQMLQLKLQKM